jgi:mannose-6-phosphate isomerase-like protein (cupin superfamily)
MRIHIHESDLKKDVAGRPAGVLINRDNGAVKGFCLGISYYDKTEYGEPGIHDDQEGFYILAGAGTARVGDEEFPVEPGSSFIAARDVPHMMKRNNTSEPLKVLWMHGAV